MANTFKFGNGNWAVKDGYALAYNDENNNFKPLPFDFTRASTATTLNRQGLIEVVPSGKPRIDFKDNTDGHLLLEPSRTNQFTYSESLNSGWVTGGATMTLTASQFVSPDGSQSASRLQIPSSGSASVFAQLESHSSGTQYTISMYAKSNTGTNQSFRLYGDYGASGNISSDFTATNEWQRFTYTFTASASGSRGTGIYNTLNVAADLQIYGIQFEAGSYATSYIPTEGSSVTRVVETNGQVVPDGIIGQTEGTVFADVDFVGVNESITNQVFFIREEGSNNGYIFAGFYQGKLNVGLRVSGSTKFDLLFGNVLSEGSYKIAIGYSSGNTKVFINGSQVGSTMTQTFGLNNFAQIFVGSGSAGTNQLGDIIRNFKIYDTRLTDTELQNLTS